MRLDLEPEYLAIVKKILSTYAKDQTIWAYGSRVKGTAHSESDLDLAIIASAENPYLESLATLKALFSESNLPISTDILNWSAIPEKFQADIKQRHVVLQESAT